MQDDGSLEPPVRLPLMQGSTQTGEGLNQGRVDAEMMHLWPVGE